MMTHKMPYTIMPKFLIHIYILSLFGFTKAAVQNYSIPYVTRSNCLVGPTDVFHQFYDFSQLACKACTQNSTYQTATEDGLSCTCQASYVRTDYIDRIDGQLKWRCDVCPDGKIASADGYACVSCDTGVGCPLCPGVLEITVERYLDGERIVDQSNESTRTCLTCLDDTSPIDTGDNRCSRCSDILSVQPTQGCECPTDRLSGGMCFREIEDLVPDSADLYTVRYENDVEKQSDFLERNVRSSHAACVNQSIDDPSRSGSEYSNLTACQLLANACVMSLYSQYHHPDTSASNDACSLHMRLVYDYADSTFPRHRDGLRSLYQQIQEWRSSMPWLFYKPDSIPQILDDRSIPTVFTPGMNITYVLAKYTVEGEFVSLEEISPSDIQLCRDTLERLSKAFTFGVGYEKSCDILVDNLFEDPFYETYFYDLYLQYTDDKNEVKLHAVPILITNYINDDGEYVNQENDRSFWQLMRRFFLVDRISGVTASGSVPEVLRYAESMTLHIRLQELTDGKIYPPYLEITYNQVLDSDIGGDEGNNTVQSSFRVKYSMDTSDFDLGMSVATGVLCALAVLYAVMRTFTWNKRMGKMAIDFLSLGMFVVYTCGALANAFFIVSLGFSISWIVLYKGQSVFYLVPDDRGNYYLQAFLGSAFALKTLQLIHLVIHQVTVDLFLVDWEKPRRMQHDDPSLQMLRGQNVTDEIAYVLKQQKKTEVSIWRTYMVANEWNEIQTVRRVQPVIHMLVVLLLLHCVGMDELARYESQANVSYNAESYHGEYNLVFRFAVFAVTYILVAIAQRLFYWLLWSRFKQHPINNFIDLCALTNISVFIMVQDHFGYYVHGRSPHGPADVSLANTLENINREEENLCSSRGLVQGEDQQTFETALPHKFRNEYNKVLWALRLEFSKKKKSSQQGAVAATRVTVDMEKKIQAYHVLNRFLQNYIDHNIKNMDYIIARKNLAEKVLDTEVKDSSFLGFFYYDNGHAFDKTLFYGHEATLQMFEMLFFTMVDFLSYNYVLAGVLTYFVDMIIVKVRKALGKRNVAKKTMVDERFLI